MSIETTISTLNEWGRLAFEHEEEFLKEFTDSDTTELIGIWWAEEQVKFNFLVESGQTITDSVPMSEWIEFVNKQSCGSNEDNSYIDGIGFVYKHSSTCWYSNRYDTNFNPTTGEWEEGKCDDPDCDFCKNRPEKAYKI